MKRPGSAYVLPMTAAEAAKTDMRAPQLWPLSVQAYHALGEMGLIPERTELLYGQVFCKMPKSPFHALLLMRLLDLLRRATPPGVHVRQDQPILCADSEPEPDLSVVRGSIEDYASEHPRTAELVVEVCVTSHEYRPLQAARLCRRGHQGSLAGVGAGAADRTASPPRGRTVSRTNPSRSLGPPGQHGAAPICGGIRPVVRSQSVRPARVGLS